MEYSIPALMFANYWALTSISALTSTENFLSYITARKLNHWFTYSCFIEHVVRLSYAAQLTAQGTYMTITCTQQSKHALCPQMF